MRSNLLRFVFLLSVMFTSGAFANVIYDFKVIYGSPTSAELQFSMEFADSVGPKTETDLIVGIFR